jgi:hypothetical protein
MMRFTSLLGLALIPSAFGLNVANVLIYSYTAGYRHESIPVAVASLTARGPSYGINFENTEEPADITDDNLAKYDALFFLSNTDRGKHTYYLPSTIHIFSIVYPDTLLMSRPYSLNDSGTDRIPKLFGQGWQFRGRYVQPFGLIPRF